jgi:glucokinase
MCVVIGCDIGGSHITTSLVDLEAKSIIEDTLCRRIVDSKQSAEFIIREWSKCIQESLTKGGLQKASLGIAIPAPFDYENGICLIKDQDKFNQLYNINIKKLLADALSISTNEIAMDNDASCYLLGEMIMGAGMGYNTSFGITLGTGLGSAAGKGLEAMDADLWKSEFKDSIAEDYLSTDWFVKSYSKSKELNIHGVKELVERIDKDPEIVQLFQEFANNLGEFIFNTIRSKRFVDPEVIILGGNISQSHDLFLDSTLNYLTSKGIKTPIKIAKLGEMSAIYGAAGLWEKE